MGSRRHVDRLLFVSKKEKLPLAVFFAESKRELF